MAIFSTQIQGIVRAPPAQLPAITKGRWSSNIEHSFEGLTECPCGYLDRFSPHGTQIRTAYEDAVVNAIAIPSAFGKKVHIAVVGSGGLLQEAIWLTKLYQKQKPLELALHLIDLDYKKDDHRILSLVKYVRSIVPVGSTLDIYGWNSCETLRTEAEKIDDFIPNLVIGMDTEHATDAAKKYQWELIPGDIEKTLLVKWEITEAGLSFVVYSRRGSADTLKYKTFTQKESTQAAECIKAAVFVGI
jgi:hypothetical protein